MKRHWVIVVTDGIGSEMHDQIHASRFIGPFTNKRTAERFASRISIELDQSEDKEHPIAYVMELEPCPSRSSWRAAKLLLGEIKE